jgi:hypothetical protein
MLTVTIKKTQRRFHRLCRGVLPELRRQGEALDHAQRAQRRTARLPTAAALLLPVRQQLHWWELHEGAVHRWSPPPAGARLCRVRVPLQKQVAGKLNVHCL